MAVLLSLVGTIISKPDLILFTSIFISTVYELCCKLVYERSIIHIWSLLYTNLRTPSKPVFLENDTLGYEDQKFQNCTSQLWNPLVLET